MKKILNLRNSLYAVAITAIGLAVACTPEEVKSGNPLTGPELDASFTASVSDAVLDETAGTNTMTITVNATSNDPNIKYHLFRITNKNGEYVTATDKGDFKGESHTYTLQSSYKPLPDGTNASGTYKIKHTVVGYIGGNIAVSEQSFTVDLPVPANPNGNPEFGPNVVTSPDFENAGDWSIFQTSDAAGVNWTINSTEGTATANGGNSSYPGAGIYQAVDLEAGDYLVEMNASGDGSTDTWFEVYIGTVMPQDQVDYSDGGIIIGLNTWTGCGNTAFDGQLSAMSCVGTGNPVTIPADGTYYLVIKTGSGADNGVNNITISDVSLKKVL